MSGPSTDMPPTDMRHILGYGLPPFPSCNGNGKHPMENAWKKDEKGNPSNWYVFTCLYTKTKPAPETSGFDMITLGIRNWTIGHGIHREVEKKERKWRTKIVMVPAIRGEVLQKITVVISCSWFVCFFDSHTHTLDAFSSAAMLFPIHCFFPVVPRVKTERSLPSARSRSKSRSESASSSDARTGAAWCSDWNWLKLNTVYWWKLHEIATFQQLKWPRVCYSFSHHSSRYSCYRAFWFLHMSSSSMEASWMPAETQGKEVNLAYQWVPACPSTDEIDLSNHVVDERAPSVSSIALRTPSSKCQNLIRLRMLQPLGDNPPLELGVTWLVQAFHAVFQCILH